ncbi:uncharacterized protein LOC113318253 isoform X2 [Papaver somniferum]|uniref:uncharacterized protein LOC113318253 isoform X2 n=1 Tax=Papaver somniferum TaxID=3469 RepID=UPI000E6F8490|nr:uncharacterized protein LOC113318253 isoform X2 [Papaver somniferum]
MLMMRPSRHVLFSFSFSFLDLPTVKEDLMMSNGKELRPSLDWTSEMGWTAPISKLGSTAIGLKSKGVVVVVKKSITSPLLFSFLPNHFLLHKLVERWGRLVYANIQ